ncbi:hypothetical protein OL599_22830, partial [Rhodovastum sp. RN2-1]|nr:hypothetical protein [Limobrevibacterium gyesilva]
MRFVLAGILALLPVLGALPAQAQVESREGIALQNQILELRRDVQSLRDQIGRGGGSSALGSSRSSTPAPGGGGEMTAALLDRVTRLEDEVRQLRGRVDEADNARQRQGEDLGKQIEDLNFKIDNGTGRPAGAARPAPGAAPAQSPPAGSLGAAAA